MDEAIEYLRQKGRQQTLEDQEQKHQLGLVFAENPDVFVSLSKGYFNLYNLFELLVVAYEEQHRLNQAVSESLSLGR